MKGPPGKGLNFFTNVKGLPDMTFLAFEAVVWIKANVEGVETYTQAVKILHELLAAKLICHASGDANLHFNNGFYLFAIVQVSDKFEYPSPF